jgi:hypothetical protein
MRSFFPVLLLTLLTTVGLSQQQAKASGVQIQTVVLTDGGGEVMESFSSQTPEYEFEIGFTSGTSFYLDMAFETAPGEQYDLQFQPPINGSLGNVPFDLSYVGPESVSLDLAPRMNVGYTTGTLDLFVTLTNVSADPFGGFEISNSPITLDIPVGTTPIPAALPLFATGLGALGLFGWRRKRKNIAAIAGA